MTIIELEHAIIMEDYLTKLTSNPLYLSDESWLNGVAVRTGNIRRSADTILAFSSPKSSAWLSESMTQMAMRSRTAVEYLNTGIKNRDETYIVNYINTMGLVADDARHINGLVRKWCVGR